MLLPGTATEYSTGCSCDIICTTRLNLQNVHPSWASRYMPGNFSAGPTCLTPQGCSRWLLPSSEVRTFCYAQVIMPCQGQRLYRSRDLRDRSFYGQKFRRIFSKPFHLYYFYFRSLDARKAVGCGLMTHEGICRNTHRLLSMSARASPQSASWLGEGQ